MAEKDPNDKTYDEVIQALLEAKARREKELREAVTLVALRLKREEEARKGKEV